MTERERKKLSRRFRHLWKYSSHLKEGGRAWEKAIQEMENIKSQIFPE